MQEFVKNELSNIDLSWETHSGKFDFFAPLLIAKSRNLSKDKPTICLNGHLDTVFNKEIIVPIKKIDNKLYGPGTIDMKGGLLIILETIQRLQELNAFENIILIFTPNEEYSIDGSFPILKKIIPDVDIMLTYEGNGNLKTKPENYKTKNLVTSRKGYFTFKVRAKAKGGHSGVITKEGKRHSAVHELIHLSKFLLNQANYSKDTSINIGRINGGTGPNVIAENAEMEFDVRVSKISEYNRIIETIKNIKPNDKHVSLDIESLVKMPPFECTKNTQKLFELSRKILKESDIKVEKESRGGASDINTFLKYNPDIACLDNLGPSGGGEHTTNEFIFLDSIEPQIDISVKLIPYLLKNYE